MGHYNKFTQKEIAKMAQEQELLDACKLGAGLAALF